MWQINQNPNFVFLKQSRDIKKAFLRLIFIDTKFRFNNLTNKTMHYYIFITCLCLGIANNALANNFQNNNNSISNKHNSHLSMELSKNQIEVKEAIEFLVYNASNYNIEKLTKIYHPDLRITTITETGQVIVLNYQENIDLFTKKRDSGDGPLSTYTEFNYIDANDTTAQVVVTRKADINRGSERLFFCIDLIKENGKWLIFKEVAFSQSN